MKRSTAVLVFLLAMAICSAAAADTLFQSYRFQFNLPDGWVYAEASDSHIQCKRTDSEGWTETIDVYEPRFGRWPENKNDLPSYIKKGFDFDQDAEVEWIEVAGFETAIVDAPGYENRDAYMTILPGNSRKNVACLHCGYWPSRQGRICCCPRYFFREAERESWIFFLRRCRSEIH